MKAHLIKGSPSLASASEYYPDTLTQLAFPTVFRLRMQCVHRRTRALHDRVHSLHLPRPAGKLWPELLDTLTRIGSAQLLRGHVARLLSLTESDLLTSVLSTANAAVVVELRKPPAEDGGQQMEGAPLPSADLGIFLYVHLLPML